MCLIDKKKLFKGVGPTAQRAAVIAAVELPVYDFCKQHLMGTFGDKISNHFLSSFVASLGSAVASTPIDVIRVSILYICMYIYTKKCLTNFCIYRQG